MQIKTTMMYHLTQRTNTGEGVKERAVPNTLLVGMQVGTVIIEDRMKVR